MMQVDFFYLCFNVIDFLTNVLGVKVHLSEGCWWLSLFIYLFIFGQDQWAEYIKESDNI